MNYFLPGYDVAFLKFFKSQLSNNQYQIELDQAKVKSITQEGQTLNHLKLSGEFITSIQLDGKSKTYTHYLGTDELGRDLYTRILYGGQISLMVGVVATLVSLIIGVTVGSISGYLGGKVDRLIMNGVDILYAIPFMFLVILLTRELWKKHIDVIYCLGSCSMAYDVENCENPSDVT